jgi:hypothetical protein
LTSEAKRLVLLAQPNVLVFGHRGTVTLPGDSGVICYRELDMSNVFTEQPVFSTHYVQRLFGGPKGVDNYVCLGQEEVSNVFLGSCATGGVFF